MEDQMEKPQRKRHHDRIALDQISLKRIDGWIDHVTQGKGVTLTRKDMLNWLVHHQAEVLAPSAVAELKTQFFNEVRFLQHAIKELKAAKSRGESSSLDDVLGNNKQPIPRKRTKKTMIQNADSKEHSHT